VEEESSEEETIIPDSQAQITPLEHCFAYQLCMEENGLQHIRESWRHQFIVAIDYVRQHGLDTINIPDTTTHTYNDMTRDIGSWIKHQRVSYREGRLSVHRRNVLEDCGINWFKKQEHWDSMYLVLKKYKETHNNEDPPTTYMCDSGENLGEWCAIQRKEYLKGTLSEDHRTKLEAHNFVWKPRANVWNENYEKLVSFLSGNHDVLPVKGKTGTREQYGLDLSTWLSKQKQKIKSGRITMEQKTALNALPETARTFLSLSDDA